ncbi:MAG: RusA family crossover junction endodeoxyribonuclease [Paraclostridium sp.]
MRIYITPTTKERPRFSRNGYAYTTNKTRDFEEQLKWEYVKANGKNYGESFIEVDLVFAFTVPKSWSKKKKEEALKGNIRPTSKDLDNIIKATTDSLNGVAYKDDRYIYSIKSQKKYDIEEYIEINIKELAV